MNRRVELSLAVLIILAAYFLARPVILATFYLMSVLLRPSSFWMGALVIASPVVLWVALAQHARRQWVRYRDGLCTRCGYALIGNVTGICPECGTVIPVSQLIRLRSDLAHQREHQSRSGMRTDFTEHQIRELDRLIDERSSKPNGSPSDTITRH